MLYHEARMSGIRRKRRRRLWNQFTYPSRQFKIKAQLEEKSLAMEEAASRTARLQALRAAKERRAQSNPDAASAASEASVGDAVAAAGPKVIFRNYQPADKSLQETAKLPRAGVVKPAVAARVVDDDNVLNVIAKKANWDLKRDLQPKLQKLERRTEVSHAHLSCASLSPPRFFTPLQKAIRDVFREQEKARTALLAGGT